MLSHKSVSDDYVLSLHSAFRAATQDIHRRVDRHPLLISLVRRDLTWIHYELVLRTFLDLYHSLQPMIVAAIDRLGGGFEYAFGDRIDWLQRDLINLSSHCERIPQSAVRTQWPLPPVDGIAAVIGALYVIEGSTLGGQVIAPRLSQSLGIDCDHGAGFFHGYGDETHRHWEHFWRYAASRCPPQCQAAALFTAVELFKAIEYGIDDIWLHKRTL